MGTARSRRGDRHRPEPEAGLDKNNVTSIRQNSAAHPVPDVRNLGVVLRILLGVNFLVAAGVLAANRLAAWPEALVEAAAWVEPLVFAALALLSLLRDFLWRLSGKIAQVVVIFVVMGLVLATFRLLDYLGLGAGGFAEAARGELLASMISLIMLVYFEQRSRAFSPMVAEARLQALTARIRPHFLFNSLNAVLGMIRQDPKGAERALEELADLFRALMRDASDLCSLEEELALGRQYLDLEKLRLGDRLQVSWQLGRAEDDRDVPGDILVPPLMLQPLLENAVYHGVEPLGQPGTVEIRLWRENRVLFLEVENPLAEATDPLSPRHRPGMAGSGMALANIRERLDLYFDLEARLETRSEGDRYRVRISLPMERCRHKQ